MRSDAPGRRPMSPPRLAACAAAGLLAAVVLVEVPSGTPAAASPPADKPAPQVLFAGWPDKPDVVFVFTGNTLGYLQKCGCSNPQKGGLERRYNLIKSLKDRGWNVVPIDLGDVIKPNETKPDHVFHLRKQTVDKYETVMKSMQVMGYRAVGLGRDDFAQKIDDLFGVYSQQKKNAYPRVLAANVENKSDFPTGRPGESSIAAGEVIDGDVTVGVTGLIGAKLMDEVAGKLDPNVKFAKNNAVVLAGVLKDWAALKKPPEVPVLLYQGPLADAKVAAAAFPQFRVVVCEPRDPEPPNNPTVVKNAAGVETLIVELGHKGQNVGVLAAKRNPKTPGGWDFFYQRVVVSDEYETPAGDEGKNPVLKVLQDYSDKMKDKDYLADYPKATHPVQARFKEASFAGSESCKACHPAEFDVWDKAAKHSNAYAALAKVASKPTGRQFDGECIVCHVVGFKYDTGYVDEKTTKTLKNVGCENCHGPGSLHNAAEAADAKPAQVAQRESLRLALSSWKGKADERLPPADMVSKLAKLRDPEERRKLVTKRQDEIILAVSDRCMECHTSETDPKFLFEDYWPKVVHSGLKGKAAAKEKDDKPVDDAPVVVPDYPKLPKK